ncbi:MAG: DUF1573 domain-containing protein [Ignavibacteriae bacterium]|nr:MAG: DUF1573 domain-containing protein [Ignavibacteriota bacterium]
MTKSIKQKIFMKYISIKQISVFMFSVFIVFVLFSCKNSSKEQEFTPPSIVFNEEMHDFGKVKEGPQLEYSFQFTNKGGDTLKIYNVTTRCGCTTAAPDKKEYLTNENGNIKVTFFTQSRNGKQDKDIHVSTNDPKNPMKTLKITTEIK